MDIKSRIKEAIKHKKGKEKEKDIDIVIKKLIDIRQKQIMIIERLRTMAINDLISLIKRLDNEEYIFITGQLINGKSLLSHSNEDLIKIRNRLNSIVNRIDTELRRDYRKTTNNK